MSQYEKSMKDIAVARKALEQSLLPGAAANRPMLCEVYCIPPHNHQAFYLQVYGGSGYVLLYAKTLVSDFRGNNVVMYTFGEAVRADGSAVCRGDIYCGIKYLPPEEPTITRLLQCLPETEENCLEGGMVIDGVSTVIINAKTAPPAVLGYHNSRRIEKNPMTREQADFMDELYLRIEGIIGNLLDGCEKR